MLYEYFPDDIDFYVEHIRSDSHVFVNLTKDILEALATLKEAKMVHSSLQPKYISYRNSDMRFVLIDPLNEEENEDTQKSLYISPSQFDALVRKTQDAFNPYKAEVFSFGMILLSLMSEQWEEIQSVYNFQKQRFDVEKFYQIQRKIHQKIFPKELSEIGDYIVFCMLSTDVKMMVNPEEALDTIQKLQNENKFGEINQDVQDRLNLIRSKQSNDFNHSEPPSSNERNSEMIMTFKHEEGDKIMQLQNSFNIESDDDVVREEKEFEFPDSLREKINAETEADQFFNLKDQWMTEFNHHSNVFQNDE